MAALNLTCDADIFLDGIIWCATNFIACHSIVNTNTCITWTSQVRIY